MFCVFYYENFWMLGLSGSLGPRITSRGARRFHVVPGVKPGFACKALSLLLELHLQPLFTCSDASFLSVRIITMPTLTNISW